MYAFAQLTAQTIQFISAITSSGANRSRAWIIAVAYILAQRLALPSEKVEDLGVYYRLHHATDVIEILGCLVEFMPMDSAEIRGLVENFYTFRYQAANPPAYPLAVREDKGLVDFFGLSRNFSDALLSEIQLCSTKITHHVTGLNKLLDELAEAKARRAESYSSPEAEVSYAG